MSAAVTPRVHCGSMAAVSLAITGAGPGLWEPAVRHPTSLLLCRRKSSCRVCRKLQQLLFSVYPEIKLSGHFCQHDSKALPAWPFIPRRALCEVTPGAGRGSPWRSPCPAAAGWAAAPPRDVRPAHFGDHHDDQAGALCDLTSSPAARRLGDKQRSHVMISPLVFAKCVPIARWPLSGEAHRVRSKEVPGPSSAPTGSPGHGVLVLWWHGAQALSLPSRLRGPHHRGWDSRTSGGGHVPQLGTRRGRPARQEAERCGMHTLQLSVSSLRVPGGRTSIWQNPALRRERLTANEPEAPTGHFQGHRLTKGSAEIPPSGSSGAGDGAPSRRPFCMDTGLPELTAACSRGSFCHLASALEGCTRHGAAGREALPTRDS